MALELSFTRYSLLPMKRRLEVSLKIYLFSWGETSKIIPPNVYEFIQSELFKKSQRGEFEFVLDFVLSVPQKGLKSVVSM